MRKSNILTIIGIATIILTLAGQVRSTGIATGSYYLDTPLPIADFYVGEYSNGTYFAINGSNWQNFLRSENASYVLNMVSGNMTTGKAIIGTGTFSLDSVWTIRTNQTWQGMGRGITIIEFPENMAALGLGRSYIENEHRGTTTQDYNIQLKDFEIDGNWNSSVVAGSYRIAGLNFEGVRDVLLYNIYVHDVPNMGTRMGTPTDKAHTKNVVIDSCWAENCGYNAFHFFSNTIGDCADCTVINSYANYTDSGFCAYRGYRIKFINCYAWDHNNSVFFGNGIGFTIEQSSEECLVDSCYSWGEGTGIYGQHAGIWIANNARNSSVRNSWVSNVNLGIALAGDNQNEATNNRIVNMLAGKIGIEVHDNALVSGNRFLGTTGTAKAIDVWGSNNLIIGNYIEDFGTTGIVMRFYQNNCENNTVKDNYIIDTDGNHHSTVFQIKTGTNDTRFIDNDIYEGNTVFDIQAGANDIVVERNNIVTSGTEISDSGTNSIIKWNTNYVTENSGSQTVANNENIAHGLASTPVYYDVACLNETYDSVAVMVWLDYSGIDGTNLNVCVYWLNGTAITDDVILVAWEARTWN